MSESLLKKEFKSEDLNRIRNIVKKDFTQKTAIGSGYGKAKVSRKEGDVWEEDGRTWTVKNGIRQNLTKLDSARELSKIPLTCPKCSKSMNHHLDKKMFKIHKFCFDCTIEYEAELRKLGLYEQYEKSLMKKGIAAFAKDLEQMLLQYVSDNSAGDAFITEQGDVEDWKFADKKFKKTNINKLTEFLVHTNSFTEKQEIDKDTKV